MTRVEDHEARIDNERVQNDADRKAREDKRQKTDKESFGRLLAGGQATARERTNQHQKDASTRTEGERVSSQDKHAKSADGRRAEGQAAGARVQARPGHDLARQANAALQRSQGESVASDRMRQGDREVSNDADRNLKSDGEQELRATERESADGREVERNDAHAAAAGQSAAAAAEAVDADGKRDKSRDQSDQGQGKPNAAAAEVQGAAPATPARLIPPELLEKLVSTVYILVNEKGLREFQIELKDGPLKGGMMKVTADKGRISLSFTGLGAHEQNLVEASKGELMRRLEKKGLSLSKLTVG